MNDIEKLENFKTITILYGNTFAMHTEQLKEIQESIGNVLADLYEANNRINDLLDVAKEKDRIIDEMVEHIYTGCDFDNNIKTREQIREYFEERCK